MAARVVWLVATGQVAPDEVLGLTFTTKATAELADADPRQPAQGRAAARARPRRVGDDERGGRGADGRDLPRLRRALLTEHGLRIGHEPDTRLIADASRYQLAARAVAALHRARSSCSPTRPATSSSTCSPSTPR